MKKKQQSAGTSVKHTIQKTVTCMQLSVSGFCVHKTFFPAMKCAQTAQDSKAKSKDDDDACDTAAGESHAEASSSVKQPKGKGSGIKEHETAREGSSSVKQPKEETAGEPHAEASSVKQPQDLEEQPSSPAKSFGPSVSATSADDTALSSVHCVELAQQDRTGKNVLVTQSQRTLSEATCPGHDSWHCVRTIPMASCQGLTWVPTHKRI